MLTAIITVAHRCAVLYIALMTSLGEARIQNSPANDRCPIQQLQPPRMRCAQKQNVTSGWVENLSTNDLLVANIFHPSCRRPVLWCETASLLRLVYDSKRQTTRNVSRITSGEAAAKSLSEFELTRLDQHARACTHTDTQCGR